MASDKHETRIVRKVIGGGELPVDRRVREVVAEYEDGDCRREIEVEQNGEYVPRYMEIDDDER